MGVGIDFIQETGYKKPNNPTKFSANTLNNGWVASSVAMVDAIVEEPTPSVGNTFGQKKVQQHPCRKTPLSRDKCYGVGGVGGVGIVVALWWRWCRCR